MFEGPHTVHFNGLLVHPGRNNDYTLHHSNDSYVRICWWHPEVGKMVETTEEITISVIRLDTGERWGYSNMEGVFVDTRKRHAKSSE
jgi:hypothetical protein